MASTDKVTGSAGKAAGSVGKALPTDELRGAVKSLLGAVGQRAVGSLHDKVGGMTERLTDYAGQQGNSSLVAAVTGAKDMAEGKSPTRALVGAGTAGLKDKVKNLFGGGGNGGKKLKVTNIEESIDVGVPVRMAYNQWTEFADFPSFMKKVESVEQAEDQKLNWKAQVLWSHRTWESTIQSQVPEDHIVWRSKGEKGYVDGAVTFHELAPNLTRILLVLEYHPQGFFEHTGNLWRAQGRRVRLELKHFRRHVMSEDILNPDEIEGWRGVIEDGEVVKDHESALQEEQDQQPEGQDGAGEETADSEPEGELTGEESEDDQGADLADEAAEPEDEAGERADVDEDGGTADEDEDISPNGRRPRGREGRSVDGSRASGRGSRPAGREPRSGRSGRSEEPPQRVVRRRAGARGGNSQ
jgi:uncharacterized membrane protein